MLMSSGMKPDAAAKTAVAKIINKYPQFSGALLAVDMNGNMGRLNRCLYHPFVYLQYDACPNYLHFIELQLLSYIHLCKKKCSFRAS